MVVAVTDSSGTRVGEYEYDPYGENVSTTGTAVQFRYAGQYLSTSLALYKMGARYYDPKIGRWTQTDPLDQTGDLREGNRYTYVAGNPINSTDPTGLFLDDIGDAISDANEWVDQAGKDIQKAAKDVVKFARSGSGRCVVGGIIGAAAGGYFTGGVGASVGFRAGAALLGAARVAWWEQREGCRSDHAPVDSPCDSPPRLLGCIDGRDLA